jgi:RHS repeat-associated protein
VVCRNKDANTAWTSASDGTLEERLFYCQNWRADVSAIVAAAGTMKEWDKYSAYGIPFGLPGGDTGSDGDCDATDVTQVQTWINGSQYDVRGDIDLDGDVDSNDKTTINGSFNGIVLGRGSLTGSGVANQYGYAGLSKSNAPSLVHAARHRVLVSDMGRWSVRDPIGTRDGMNLYVVAGSSPLSNVDPYGLRKHRVSSDCKTNGLNPHNFDCDPKTMSNPGDRDLLCDDLKSDAENGVGMSVVCCPRGSRAATGEGKKQLDDKAWDRYCHLEVEKAKNGEPSDYRGKGQMSVDLDQVCTGARCQRWRPAIEEAEMFHPMGEGEMFQ